MNMRVLVESFTLDELNEISNLIYERRKLWYRMNGRPLSIDEKTLVKNHKWIDAIKAYRVRYDASLLEAKTAVDVYRDSLKGIGFGEL